MFTDIKESFSKVVPPFQLPTHGLSSSRIASHPARPNASYCSFLCRFLKATLLTFPANSASSPPQSPGDRTSTLTQDPSCLRCRPHPFVCSKSRSFSQLFCKSLPTASFIKTQLTCHHVCSLPACPPFPSPSLSLSLPLLLSFSFPPSVSPSLYPFIPPSSPREEVATAPFFPIYSRTEPATFYGVG